MPSQKCLMYFRGFEMVNCHKSAKKDVKLLDNVSQLVSLFCLQKTIAFLIHTHCTYCSNSNFKLKWVSGQMRTLDRATSQ